MSNADPFVSVCVGGPYHGRLVGPLVYPTNLITYPRMVEELRGTFPSYDPTPHEIQTCGYELTKVEIKFHSLSLIGEYFRWNGMESWEGNATAMGLLIAMTMNPSRNRE